MSKPTSLPFFTKCGLYTKRKCWNFDKENLTVVSMFIWERGLTELAQMVPQFLSLVWTALSTQFVRKVNLLESLLVLDGVVNAGKFLKEYIVYKASTNNNLIDKQKLRNYREDILQQCKNLYILDTIDRYIFYSILYFNYVVCEWVLLCVITSMGFYTYRYESLGFLYAIHCILTIPIVQNKIFQIKQIENAVSYALESKRIFIKYSLSKIIISYLKSFNEGGLGIKNYHILMLYHHLNLSYAYNFIQSYCFIYLLHYLRRFDVTYYYYKAIKLAYFYNTGFNFNVISREDSLYIINIIIKEKRWKDLVKVEVVNALYNLMSNRLEMCTDTSHWLFYISQFLAVWSIVCGLKLLNMYLNTTFLILYLSTAVLWNNAKVSDSRTAKKILVTIVTYGLIILNTNDLVISMVIFGQEILYIFVDELIFFIKNEKDIKKVLKHFEKKETVN